MLKEKEAQLQKEFWEEGNDFLVGRPCSKHISDSEVPVELNRSKRGEGRRQFGVIAKLKEGGKPHLAGDLRKSEETL